MTTPMICTDCGFPMDSMNESTRLKGSAVREPGEAVCRSDMSRRNILVREVDKLPNTLAEIRLKRAVRA